MTAAMPPQPGSTGEPPGAMPGAVSRFGDNLDLLKALFLAVLSTAVVYEVFPLPFVDDRVILDVFDNWVSETIAAMGFWSLYLIGFKYLEHRRQTAALRAFIDPHVEGLLAEGINARTADGLLNSIEAHLRQQRVRHFEHSAIFRRVYRVLHHVRSVPRKEGVHELLDYQAQIDVKKLDASYTVLQVFLWAIPILGFIGTVLGIAEAVREFAGFIQTAEGAVQFNAQMRGALAGVTSGLGVAFNTTFLALVLAIPVMLLTSLLQKSEEELLLEIEEYCLGELLPRLSFVPAGEVVNESFEEHLNRLQQLSSTWLKQFEPLVRSLGFQVDMIRHQMSGVQPLIKEFTDRLIDGAAGKGGGAVPPLAPRATPMGGSAAAGAHANQPPAAGAAKARLGLPERETP